MDTGRGGPYITPISDAVSLATGRRQMSNWTTSMAKRDEAIRAGAEAYRASANKIPSRFDVPGLREWFLRGYDLAARAATLPRTKRAALI